MTTTAQRTIDETDEIIRDASTPPTARLRTPR
jgi:hypothetical protein